MINLNKKIELIFWLLIAPVAAFAGPDGASLYAQNCAVCHGSKGAGGVGVPLSKESFLESVSDDYLFLSIRKGRPGRVMPSYDQLSDYQVSVIVDFIRSWSTKPAPMYSKVRIAGNQKNGSKLYQKNCASCHGVQGEGGTGTGVTFSRPRDLPIIAPALNNPGFLSAATDTFIRQTLIKGRAGTPMLSFLKQGLSENDINDIVSFVRSFEKKQADISTQTVKTGEPALVYNSPYSFDETLSAVKRSIIGANFKLIRIQKFDEGLVKKGTENEKKLIVYFCNFKMLNDALVLDPRVGLFLPCRLTITEKNGQVQITSINPDMLSIHFNNDELNKLCKEISRLYRSIIEEAIL